MTSRGFGSGRGLFARIRDRFRMSVDVPKLATQSIEAGRQGRRLAAIPANTVALNDLIRRWGATAVARSRYLCLNNPHAASAKEAFIAALAGFGCKPSPLGLGQDHRRELMLLWNDWTQEADADGVLDFYGMQSVAAGELFEAGEVFAIFERPRVTDMEHSGVPMQVRLLPSEMLPFNDDTPRRGVLSGNTVKMGIEFDAKGRRVAYHFLTRHPGDFSTFDASTAITERVPAERVAHMFRPLRPGQLRGIPHTLSSLITLAMIDLYDDAELERKRTTALFAGFVTSPAQEAKDESEVSATIFGNSLDAYTDQVALEPGVMAQLAPGEQVQFAEPSDVGSNYEAFQYRNLLRAAAGMGVPYYSMTGDPNKANYSALRAGLVEFKRRIVPMQHGVLIQQFCRRVWHRWMDAAAFVGALPWPRSTWLTSRRVLSRHKWIPPHWDYVDPQKDAAAEILLINNLLKSRSDSIEEQGFDPEEVDERIALDNEREAALGLVRRSQPGTPATPANENAPRGSGSEGGGAGETEEHEEADAQE